MESSLKAQIQKYLVESGNYENYYQHGISDPFRKRISNNLNDKLLQDGWMDEVRRMTMNEINTNKAANYADVLAKIEPQALITHFHHPDLVDQSTRNDVLTQIKAFLEDIVETE